MKIHLPNSAFLGNIDSFLRGFDPSSPDSLEITMNEKWISVHPLVLSMVAAIGKTVEPEKIMCCAPKAKSSGYLERMGLFQLLGVSSGISITAHEPAGRFVPLKQIQTQTELSLYTTDMIPLLKVTPGHAQVIVHIIGELARNVLEHSRTQDGAILCAQYYEKSNSIRIGIADIGAGIKSTINHSYPATTHLEAIRLALMPGVTGTTRTPGGNSDNAGFGLFFIKSIACVNSDLFVIYSGDSFFKLQRKQSERVRKLNLHMDPFDDRHSKSNEMPFWPGTAVGIDITLEQTRELSVLLEAIGRIYDKAIREQKAARYKRPRFE